MATKKAASKSKLEAAAKTQARRPGKEPKPELELFYRVLTSFLFNHQVFQMGSVEHFSQAEAELLLARGVIKEAREIK
jgi:hypothetical protein